MRPRTVETTLAKSAKLRYEHAVGSPVAIVDKFFEKGSGRETMFYAPQTDGIYLHRADELLKAALEKKVSILASRRAINPKDSAQGEIFGNKEDVLDFFELSSAAIVLLHSAVEFITNLHLEMAKSLTYKHIKYVTLLKVGSFRIQIKRSIVLSHIEILHLPLEERVKAVLPSHYVFESPTTKLFWQEFVLLKKLRDELIHITRHRAYGASRNENSVFGRLMEIDFTKLFIASENLIEYIDAECKKRPQG